MNNIKLLCSVFHFLVFIIMLREYACTHEYLNYLSLCMFSSYVEFPFIFSRFTARPSFVSWHVWWQGHDEFFFVRIEMPYPTVCSALKEKVDSKSKSDFMRLLLTYFFLLFMGLQIYKYVKCTNILCKKCSCTWGEMNTKRHLKNCAIGPTQLYYKAWTCFCHF